MGYVADGYIATGYIGQPGSPVSFSSNGDTCPFGRNPVRPGRSLSFAQPDILSAGAERIGRDYYVKNDLIELAWSRMSRWDKNRLLAWWRDVARGMGNSFIFTDVLGVTATVRFSSPRLPEISERAYDAYDVRVQLRVE